mgnify:CR=1 FL=1
MSKINQRTSVVDDGMMSVEDAAEFTGLSRSEIGRRIKSGVLRASKIGRRGLIPRKAVVEMLEKGMTT